MATAEEGDKRHVWGPRAVGSLVPRLTRAAFRSRSALAAQLLADWEMVVGPALAAVTMPRRLAGGSLTLACSGPVATELQHMSGELIARVNGHLGRIAVARLRFVQAALPSIPAVAEAARSRPVPPITGLPPGPLNDALARLGAAIAHTKTN